MKARITVKDSEIIRKASPLIFGGMLENWGTYCRPADKRNGIYGSVWVGEGSSLSNKRGLRNDVLEANKRIAPTVVRWPGGCPADVYHWMNGVGPGEKRIPQRAFWYRDLIEYNTFGTHEFMDWCREIGAEPYLGVNLGTGTPEEAANWVEYCNCGDDTRYSLLRVSNGQKEPFGVKYWGIGNETYGSWEIGQMDEEEYARNAFEYAKAMRYVDPKIKIVAVGYNGSGDESDTKWNKAVIKKAGNYIDYISIHQYHHEEEYWRTIACPMLTENNIRRLKAQIDEVMPEGKTDTAIFTAGPEEYAGSKKVMIAVDEWNVWHKIDGDCYGKLTIRDGLFAAGMMHVFLRNCDSVGMANICNLVNCDPCGPVIANGKSVYINPMGLALELYRHYTGETVLSALTEADGYNINIFAGKPVFHMPYIDCIATTDEGKKRIFIAVINRNPEDDIDCDIELGGYTVGAEGCVHELNAPGLKTVNDFDSPENIIIKEKQIAVAGHSFNYCAPAHSVSIIELAVV